MLRAVLFDWGDTLMEFEYDPELVEAGHRAGLAALDRDGLPDADAARGACSASRYEPLFLAPGTIEEIEYPGLVRELLGHVGIDVSDEELMHYLQAEHAAWAPSFVLGSTARPPRRATKSRPQARPGLECVRPARDPAAGPGADGRRGAARLRSVLV